MTGADRILACVVLLFYSAMYDAMIMEEEQCFTRRASKCARNMAMWRHRLSNSKEREYAY